MYTAEALLDIHERTHRSLSKLLAHCATLDPGAIDRPLDGFGYATVRLQLHHVIGAERYWMHVLRGVVDTGPDDDAFPTLDALAAFREEVAAETRAWLRAAAPSELDTPRRMVTWGGGEHLLVPAHVVLRTQMHAYQHQGQVVAMCRLLGRPAAGLDFPLG